ELLQPLQECRETRLSLRIARGQIHEYADAPHPLALLCARRERPHGHPPPKSVMNSRRFTLNIAGPPRFFSAARAGRYEPLRAGLPHVQPATNGPVSPLCRPELF